jgi:hypothetical protein
VSNSQHDDLIITWYLPEVVKHERQYQLQKQSLDLLPSIQKLEKLLGHNLLVTDQIIIQRVLEGIEQQITEQRINVLSLEPSSVDWNRLMLDSVYRRPPFSAGEKEKGFRDALIAEAFYQLMESSPKTAAVCRIALVTEDTLLIEAVESRTAATTNVHILQNLEELKSLINTLVSQVGLQFVEGIKERASILFFKSGHPESLYSKENILKKIIEKFSDKVNELPQGADRRKHVKTLIGGPRFKEKVRQRIRWVSRVILGIEAYRNEAMISLPISPVATSGLITGYSGYSAMSPEPPLQGSSNMFFSGDLSQARYSVKRIEEAAAFGSQAETLYKTGHVIFEVTWSVGVSTRMKLTKPKIESIDYVETTWQPA